MLCTPCFEFFEFLTHDSTIYHDDGTAMAMLMRALYWFNLISYCYYITLLSSVNVVIGI